MNNLANIKKIVESVTGIEDISKRKRTRPYPYARNIYYKIAQDKTNMSLEKIGAVVDRDHACVIHGLKVFHDLYDYEDFIKVNYEVCLLRYEYFLNATPQDVKELLKINDEIILENSRLKWNAAIYEKEKRVKKAFQDRFIALFEGLDDSDIDKAYESLKAKTNLLRDSKRLKYYNDKRASA